MKRSREALEEDGDVAAVVLFAHGAGLPSSSDWMVRWKQLLTSSTNAVEVIAFDYPYIAGGKKGAPPKAEKLVDFHGDQASKAMAKHPGHPLVLIGKSMGSRVGCMVAAKKDSNVAALVCLGYPLKGAKGVMRDHTLLELQVPVLFVQVAENIPCCSEDAFSWMQGSKDALCPLQELQEVMGKMNVKAELHVIEGGDHSFKVAKGVLKANGLTQEAVELRAANAVQKFLQDVLN